MFVILLYKYSHICCIQSMKKIKKKIKSPLFILKYQRTYNEHVRNATSWANSRNWNEIAMVSIVDWKLNNVTDFFFREFAAESAIIITIIVHFSWPWLHVDYKQCKTEAKMDGLANSVFDRRLMYCFRKDDNGNYNQKQ